VFGLDDFIASYSDGAGVWIVVLAAILLGLRHATDPDHIAAVTALIAGTPERAARRAAGLGLAWGAGHALALFAFGLPILLLDRYLPERAQQAAETLIAFVIAYLAVRLLVRWRRGALHVHEHKHVVVKHSHVHAHASDTHHGHAHPSRSRAGAFGIGLVHGIGGSAGVGILLVAAIESTWLSVGALALLAIFTGVSMVALSTGFGAALASRSAQASFERLAPVLGVMSLAFGVWYATAAWGLTPYPF
jgi:ABC-type nickel/cobalt efflux system permease component RcnA